MALAAVSNHIPHSLSTFHLLLVYRDKGSIQIQGCHLFYFRTNQMSANNLFSDLLLVLTALYTNTFSSLSSQWKSTGNYLHSLHTMLFGDLCCWFKNRKIVLVFRFSDNIKTF